MLPLRYFSLTYPETRIFNPPSHVAFIHPNWSKDHHQLLYSWSSSISLDTIKRSRCVIVGWPL